MSENDLSRQSFCSLWGIFFHRQRVKDLLRSFICLGISAFFMVAYLLADKSTPGFWIELAPFIVPGFATFSLFFFVLAYWRSPLAWARGEPEDSEVVTECLKRCLCCQGPSESINMERRLSRTDLDNISIGSMRNWSLHYNNLRNRAKRARMEVKNSKSIDSGQTWYKCICCQKTSNQEVTANTTENQTKSRTDPTDSISQEMEMIVSNLGRQGLSLSQQSSADVTNSADSGKSTCIESALSCQNSDFQEPIELMQSRMGFTDCRVSLPKDLEMDDGSVMQNEASGFSEKMISD